VNPHTRIYANMFKGIGPKGGCINVPKSRTDECIDKEAGRQTDRQTDRQTETL